MISQVSSGENENMKSLLWVDTEKNLQTVP